MQVPDSPPHSSEVTALLQELGRGNQDVVNDLARLVHGELRRLAARAMRRESPAHTLQPTALANEVFLKLVGERDTKWQNSAHFFAIAAQGIRRILVDHARGQKRLKRDHGLRVTLDESIAAPERSLDVLALEDALKQLEAAAPRQARIVELRYFGGLEIDETATLLNVSTATVKRDWAFARAFLVRKLRSSG